MFNCSGQITQMQRHATFCKHQQYLHWINIRKLTNFNATKLLKQLYTQDNQHKYNNAQSEIIVNKAFDTFNEVSEPRNHFLINTMLKLCIHFENTKSVHRLWDYIQTIDTHIHCNISYPLIVKYSISSDHYDINECIKILEWMDKFEYKLKIHGSFVSKLLLKCNNISQLKYIHRLIEKDMIQNCVNNTIINTVLITEYGRFGDVEKAQKVFESIVDNAKDVILICGMMTVFINNGINKKALDLYDSIIEKDIVSHSLALQSCSNIKLFDKGQNIVRNISEKDKSNNIKVQTALIEFYGNFGKISFALHVFDIIKDDNKDITVIGAMMKAYINNGYYDCALDLYNGLHIKKDDICYGLALKACGYLKDYDGGAQIHEILMKDNQAINNIKVKTALIDFYGNCSYVCSAIDVFDSINVFERDTVCIGAMMNVFINDEQYFEALQIYDESADNIKMNICHLALKACCGDYNFVKGKQIADSIVILNFDNIDIINTLITFYGHFGDIKNALNIFNCVDDDKKDIVTVNAMMTVCINNEYYGEALYLYESIDGKWIKDEMTHSLAIKVCAEINNLNRGKQIIDSLSLSPNNIQIQNTLIDFYGHCGELSNSLKMFNSICDNKKDIVTINAMMSSYINNGNILEANKLFNQTIKQLKLKADCKTYSILLNGCSHNGDIDRAINIWINQIKDKKIQYNHYIITCLVDCYSRKGYLKDALHLIYQYEEVTQRPYYSMWIALLSGCRKHKNIKMALNIYKEIQKRFHDNYSIINRAAVLLSNIKNQSNL